MKAERFSSLDEFTSQYTGKYDPLDNNWFGMDFMFNGKKYRFNTWNENNPNIKVFPDGRKAKFCIGKRKENYERRYTPLAEFACMEDVLDSTVIDGIPFNRLVK